MSKYFLENGYLNVDTIMNDEQPFVFVLGGRGIGKTYGVTNWLCDHCAPDKKFIYMRRTDSELAFINSGNIYSEHHPNIDLNRKSKVVEVIDENSKDVIGYHIALSTIHNIRGFAMQDVAYILFDEFIAERGTVIRRFSGEQMLNAYETINRNRELKGKAPVKCVFLSNYNTAESDIMTAFGFEDEVYTYSKSKPIGVYKDKTKELIMINESTISDKKAKTVLYQTAKDKDFEKMALENDGSLSLMPIAHYGRRSYEYLGTLGIININRLYSGYYYLTRALHSNGVEKKGLLKYVGVYHAYVLGNVYTSDAFVAQTFVNYYEK